MTARREKFRVGRRWGSAGPIAGVLVVILSAGCDSLLDVTDPDIVTPENLGSPAGLATLVAGALGDLALAMDGSASGHGATPGLVHYSGTLSDEYEYSGTFPTRREVDQRGIADDNTSTGLVFTNLHRARTAAGRAASAIQEFSNPAQDPQFAEMRSIEGLIYIVFGENFCSGVPFSTALETGELQFGQPMPTSQMFQEAIIRLDEAIATPGGSQDRENLARVLKARALLNLADFSGATAVVASVPTDFVYAIEHSSNSPSQQNGLFTLSAIRRQYSIADNKGLNGLAFRSANDPRVLWDRTPDLNGQDDQTPYFNQLKYPDDSAPVVMASGVEARLIEAEAALQSGPGGAFESIHNALRATVGLGAISTTGMTQTQAEDLHFSERAFWMWSTAHRVGDLRRLVRQYGRGTEATFPTGTYFKGGSYGSDPNMPLPLEEMNNPNSNGCLDRSP